MVRILVVSRPESAGSNGSTSSPARVVPTDSRGSFPFVVSFGFTTVATLSLPQRPYEKPYPVARPGLFHQIAQQPVE